MATVHMTYGEVSRDFAAVLEKVRAGIEVVVEEDHRAVAVIHSPKRAGRPISECIESARVSGSQVTLDAEFWNDVEQGINQRQELGATPLTFLPVCTNL